MFKSRILLMLALVSASYTKMMHSIPSAARGTLEGIKRPKYKALKKFCTARYEYSLKHIEKIYKYINTFNAETNNIPIDSSLEFAIINYTGSQRNSHKETHKNTEDHVEEEQEDILENVNAKKPKKTRRKAKNKRS